MIHPCRVSGSLRALAALAIAAGGSAPGQEPPPMPDPVLSSFRVELPNLVCPATLIIDDGTVIFDPPATAGGDRWALFEDFVRLCDRHGVRGKFSVLPYDRRRGMVDRLAEGPDRERLRAYVQAVQEKLVPRFDLTPEILSHGPVIDLATDRPLAAAEGRPDPGNEARWSQGQDEDTLERYLGRALTALQAVGLEANGITSPWDFGLANEAAYARAVGRSLRRVGGHGLAWYFLRMTHEESVEPVLMLLDRARRACVVSVVASAGMVDMNVAERCGQDPAAQADAYLTADGRGGLLPRLIANRSHLVLCGHWQCLAVGIPVYEQVFQRLEAAWSGRYQWMTCSAIARYHVAQRTACFVHRRDGAWTMDALLPCPGFTIACTSSTALRGMSVGGRQLRLDAGGGCSLAVGCWRQVGDQVQACFDLEPGAVLAIQR
jgi:hypothetical protein